MKTLPYSIVASTLLLAPVSTFPQAFDITQFDAVSKGPWSEVGRTTLMVPKVPNGSIKLDGSVSPTEYGGFKGTTVTPGDNAWILNFPDDRTWDGPEDSSFTYYLAHDDNYFYVGVNAKDDTVNSDDSNGNFWKDDAIEIVVDALADRFDNNTDASKDAIGGHNYVNFQGRFSAWDDVAKAKTGETWASGVEWKYGENEDVFGFGKSAPGGWQMDVRFSKRMFEDAKVGNKLRNGYRMGFNIGMDDDDKKGPGTNGDKSRSQDLELQYFWANRERHKGYTAEYLETLTTEQRASKAHLQDLELYIDGTGRLSHGGTGEIFFGFDENLKAKGKILFVTSNDLSPVNADPALIAYLEAKGYTITIFNTTGSTPEALRTAAAGKDLVFISETIGSTTVVDPAGDGKGIFSLKDTDIPIISCEAYMFDNAEWVKRTEDGSNDWTNWGNTGRSELVDVDIQDGRDSLYIQKATHPIASGFSAGKLKVYQTLYSFNFGVPSSDAKVVASVQSNGSYPTLFVYEKGDKLVDGSVAPNKRIGFFLGQTANPNANTTTDFADLTEAGRTLLLNTVAYAIGSTQTVAPTVSVSRDGTQVIVTYAGGVLQSGDQANGPWKDETAASPVKLQPTGAKKFYRTKK